MKWKMIKKGNKWKRKLVPDTDELITGLIVLIVANIVVIQLIIRGV